MIAQLIVKLPELKVSGEIPPEIAEKLSEIKATDQTMEEKLAVKIDAFAKSFNPYGYADDVDNPEANIDMIATDIRNGEVEYLAEFLAPIIMDEDGLSEEVMEAQELLRELKEQVPTLTLSEDLLNPVGKSNTVQEETVYEESEDVIERYRAKTMEVFHELDGENAESIEKTVKAKAQDVLDTFGIDAQIMDVVLIGSRSRGIDIEESDVEVIVDIKGEVPEEEIKGLLNGEHIEVAGQRIVMEPLVNDKPMPLSEYLQNEENRLGAMHTMEQMTENNQREEADRKGRENGTYANFKMVKHDKDSRYFLIADVKLPSGEITKQKPIAEFPNKKAIEKFCKKNQIHAENITHSLKHKIEHKQMITTEKDTKGQDKKTSKNRGGSIDED